MQDTEIINLWKNFDEKLEKNLSLNKKNTEEITKIKARTFIVSMSAIKLFTIIAGMIWVGVLDVIIVNLFDVANPIFLISAALQSLITTVAIVINIYQTIVIQQYDISEPIVETQRRLASLKSSTLWSARVLFLQLPFWTTFYWNESMLENGNIWLYTLQIAITMLFTYLAFWLFFNIQNENRHKKWFRFIFSGNEWDSVIKSMDLLEEIKEYDVRETNQPD